MAIIRNKQLLNHLPHVYEMKDMLEFCERYDKVYIYGCAEEQEYLLKFFDICGVKITGYVVSDIENSREDFCYRSLPVCDVKSVISDEGVGIILGLPEKYYDQIIPWFREVGFTDYFQLTGHSLIGIAEQLKPREKDEMTFEISLADHCNLACQMCDHFSQLSEPWFVDKDVFIRDIREMARIYDHEVAAITLVGGEPTLHPDLFELMKITREEFSDAQIIVLTNGVKLLELEHSSKGNFWEICKENRINVMVTVYPIKLDYIAIEEKAKEYGVGVSMSSNIHADKVIRKPKISDKHTMDPKGKVPKCEFMHCLYFNKFNVVKDGKYYMCPVEAHIDILNKRFGVGFEYVEGDCLELDKVKDWRELAEFSSNRIPFCGYCDQAHWGHDSVWKPSTKKIEEYI